MCSQIDGVEYLLHEVYGLENKAKSKETAANSSGEDEEGEEEEEGEGEEDLGAECVVCITDVRDTILLPCKHFCMCAACGEWRCTMYMAVHVSLKMAAFGVMHKSCIPPSSLICAAANLRYQSNNCPICRTPFKALLQVTALQPLEPSLELDDDEVTGNPRVSGWCHHYIIF